VHLEHLGRQSNAGYNAIAFRAEGHPIQSQLNVRLYSKIPNSGVLSLKPNDEQVFAIGRMAKHVKALNEDLV
jgi:hypothetical protein